jgi:proline iminopeptidase
LLARYDELGLNLTSQGQTDEGLTMIPLYPEIKPYKQHELPVDDLHTLYIEECGDPEGLPILFVHGGPGAGFSRDDRRFFDPEKYRIILFDQRGSGHSKPHAELKQNSTDELVDDIEKIREFFDIEKWSLFGGSWGSTLSLLYAQAHPHRVNGLILRGIFLCREQDIHWFYQAGADRIFPDYWKAFCAAIPTNERDDMLGAYYKRLTGDNELAKMGAAKSWSTWEGHCATLRPNPDIVANYSNPHAALSIARIESHYFINKTFIDENQIIENAHKLEGIPGTIIHGRYDMVCPLDNATALYDVWPDSELQIVRDAGHSSHEPSIADALVKATNALALVLSGDGEHSS